MMVRYPQDNNVITGTNMSGCTNCGQPKQLYRRFRQTTIVPPGILEEERDCGHYVTCECCLEDKMVRLL